MNRRSSSFPKWIVTVFAVGCAAIALAVLTPLDTPPPAASSPSASPRKSAAVVPPLEAFEAVWDLDLQRPLFDAPAKPATAGPLPPSSLPALRLVGTAVEPGHSVAFFETTPGSTEMKRIGDRIEGVVVSRIDADRVEVTWRGDPVVLKIVPSSPLPVTTTASPVPVAPKPLPDPGPDGIIHLFTSSEADRKSAAPAVSPR